MALREYTASLPYGLGFQDLVGVGITGTVVRLDAVVKWVPPHRQAMLEREVRIYERLQRDHLNHSRILRYYGSIEHGLILGYACHGSLRQYLHAHLQKPALHVRLRWIEQVIETVTILHSSSVFHGDISCNNFFLDENLDIKGGDFAGSPIDGEEPLICYETRSAHPKLTDVSSESEIFALGSCLYEIMAGVKPFAELDDREIERAYLQEEFPDVASLDACGQVIARCWGRKYEKVADIAADVRAEIERALSASSVDLLPYETAWTTHSVAEWVKSSYLVSRVVVILPAALPLTALTVLLWSRFRR